MRKFTFSLETLLKVRQEVENLAQKELLMARHEVEVIEARVIELREEIANLEEGGRKKQSSAPSVDHLVQTLEYLDVVRTRLGKTEDGLMRAKNIAEQKRQIVTEAMQQRKVIENLKEEQYKKWQQEALELEKNFLDEQATMRHFRHNNE